MKLTITIDMDNAAFGASEPERANEAATILRFIASDFCAGFPVDAGNRLPIRDSNGNTVGLLAIT